MGGGGDEHAPARHADVAQEPPRLVQAQETQQHTHNTQTQTHARTRRRLSAACAPWVRSSGCQGRRGAWCRNEMLLAQHQSNGWAGRVGPVGPAQREVGGAKMNNRLGSRDGSWRQQRAWASTGRHKDQKTKRCICSGQRGNFVNTGLQDLLSPVEFDKFASSSWQMLDIS